MAQLYIIAGCNGAGKTTASFSILPEMLECREFVNADLIAYGLSPLNPEAIAVAAGRIMLQRIRELVQEQVDFAFETTLSTRSYMTLIKSAQGLGYKTNLFFFWLKSPEEAILRIADRVRNGGHNIPDDVVRRRYHRGIVNFFSLYRHVVDSWYIFDSSNTVPELIARGDKGFGDIINNVELWKQFKGYAN